jgi:serine/threonine protein kinase
MGVVFLAEQTSPVARTVALKVVMPGVDTRQVLARFEAERDALSLMDHPNIAKVLDAGAAAHDQPYVVMEYVAGAPITHFCDDVRASIDDRLRLFAEVCRGAQHAHQKGIIHRDLKPANVLVAIVDGRPTPKIIDFGVAKAVAADGVNRGTTQAGALVGTLEYMSPEQADGGVAGVDTRSDVDALGVLLYELLTGDTPMTRELTATVAYSEVLRLIKEVDPPPPSERLARRASDLTTVAEMRGLASTQLTKVVRGELDWIVMRCLAKDRERRYESVAALAADVECYLNDEPVLAGPPSTWYRVRKFARRYKGPVLAASAILLPLVAGVVGTTVGMLEAKAERTKADASRDRADANMRLALQTLRELYSDMTQRWFPDGGADQPLKPELVQRMLAFYGQFVDQRQQNKTIRLKSNGSGEFVIYYAEPSVPVRRVSDVQP